VILAVLFGSLVLLGMGMVFTIGWIVGSSSDVPGPGGDGGPEGGVQNAAAANGWTFDTGLEEKLEVPAFDGPGKGDKFDAPFLDKGGELPPGARRLRLPWKGIQLTKPLPPAKPFDIKPPELKEENTTVQLAAPATDFTVGGAGRFLIFHLFDKRLQLVPEAGVLLALPYRNDRVVIYRLPLKQ
jgi:hypothetical protein